MARDVYTATVVEWEGTMYPNGWHPIVDSLICWRAFRRGSGGWFVGTSSKVPEDLYKNSTRKGRPMAKIGPG
jgi:hypothetical protein